MLEQTKWHNRNNEKRGRVTRIFLTVSFYFSKSLTALIVICIVYEFMHRIQAWADLVATKLTPKNFDNMDKLDMYMRPVLSRSPLGPTNSPSGYWIQP